ncbi:MAG: TonB-dependent receptor [Novosphingobium sp.]|nr:TonB-dependent receptor [Novosphingobium sp.]
MTRFPSALFAASVLISTPALAKERVAEIDVPAVRLDQAIRILSRQSGVSIGFRDSSFAGIPVRAVHGRLTVAQALRRMLRDSRVRARLIAPDTYLIEPVPHRPQSASAAARKPEPRPAPQAPPPPPVEIVVTGSKRDVPLGAYPGGVQIIDGDRLSTADSTRGTSAIEARVASVVSTHLGPGRNKLFIRGIADSSFVGPTQATVGQYWGNSRITYAAPDPSLRLYDVRSIEVLEGPQGTLYGAGSLGGVVRVVPRSPDLDSYQSMAWGGVQAVQHGKPGVDGGAVVNLPLQDDRLAFRAVGFGAIEGGYIDDTGRGKNDVNRVKTFGGRAALRFEPGDGWTLDANALGQTIDGDDSQYSERGGNLSRSSSIAQPFRNDFWLVDLVARKQWDNLELTTSLGYARQYVFEQFDGVAFTRTGDLVVSASPSLPREDFVLTDSGEVILSPTAAAPTAGVTQSNHIHMFTAETRLARRGPDGTGWLAGVSLLHNEGTVNRDLEESMFGMALTGARNRVREATLYGEGTVEPIDRLTLTLGGRLTHSRLSGSSEDATQAVAFSADPQAAAARSETRVLPSAALAYRPDSRTTLFARYQQGFRPGGVAVRRDFIQRFKGDRVETYEAGGRYRNGTLELEASASLTDWRNIQADLIDGFGFPTTANVGDGRVLSFGVTSRWRPLPGLEIDAAVYLNDTKVTGRATLTPVTGSSGLDSSDASEALAQFTRLPNIADVTGRFGFAYSAPLSDRLDFRMDGYARYVGKSTLGIGPILGQLQGDYLDTGLEFRLVGERYGVSLALTNLLDSRGNRFALGSPFLVRDRNQITPLQPRTVRLGFEVAF